MKLTSSVDTYSQPAQEPSSAATNGLPTPRDEHLSMPGHAVLAPGQIGLPPAPVM